MRETPGPDELRSILIRTMVLACVRNSMLEDIDTGLTPVTRIGDYLDVTVIDVDGCRTPWPEASHIDDAVMRELMG